MAKMFDGAEFGREVLDLVKGYLESQLLPVVKKLEDLEKALADQPKPLTKSELVMDLKFDSAPLVAQIEELRKEVSAIEIPEIPELPELPELPDIDKMVEEAFTVQAENILATISAAVKEEVAKIEPIKGEDVDMEEVKVHIERCFEDMHLDEVIQEKVSSKAVELIAEIEIPTPKDGTDGVDGKDVDMTLVLERVDQALVKAEESISAMVTEKVAAIEIPTPKDGIDGVDGKDADMDLVFQKMEEILNAANIEKMIDEHVKRAVDALPPPENGKDGENVDMDAVRTAIIQEVREAVEAAAIGKTIDALVDEKIAALPKPKDGIDGKDADPYCPTPEELGKVCEPLLQNMVAALPVPVDGKSVTVEDVTPLILETVEKHVSKIPVPKDGIGLAGMFIDRDGKLVATMTNGETRDLGMIVGKEGDPGRDGFTFDEMEEVLSEDGREIVRRYTRGEQVKEFRFPYTVPRYLGVFKEGVEYSQGDIVTYGGSAWHCNASTKGKPADGDSSWQLMVKRGRDGKNGVVKDLKPVHSLPVGKPSSGKED